MSGFAFSAGAAQLMASAGQGSTEPRPQQGKKRSAPYSAEEGLVKVKRTVGWYNHNGGLQQPIIYKTVRSSLESIKPRDALKILKGLEDNAGKIRNPTAWVQSAAERLGPDADIKVRKTIAWYNRHGNLQAPIQYDEVRSVFGALPAADGCAILKSLEGKAETIREPTAWLYKAAERKLLEWGGSSGQSSSWSQAPATGAAWSSPSWAGGGKRASSTGGGGGKDAVDRKLRTTIAWYNKHGGLQQPIVFDEVGPCLGQIVAGEALKILKGLEDKAASIKNPTAWIVKAVQRYQYEQQ